MFVLHIESSTVEIFGGWGRQEFVRGENHLCRMQFAAAAVRHLHGAASRGAWLGKRARLDITVQLSST